MGITSTTEHDEVRSSKFCGNTVQCGTGYVSDHNAVVGCDTVNDDILIDSGCTGVIVNHTQLLDNNTHSAISDSLPNQPTVNIADGAAIGITGTCYSM